MVTDINSVSGITRAQLKSDSTGRELAKVVPINGDDKNLAVKEKLTLEVFNREAERVNEFLQKIDRDLKFSVDEASNRVIITVTNPGTGKIIRQIPPEELLVIADLVKQNFSNSSYPTGLLFADKV